MEVTTINKIKTIDAELLFNELNDDGHIKSPFGVWFPRIVEMYGFIERMDFFTFLLKSTGGRPKASYNITYDMAEHICILDKSKKGMILRQKYINLRKSVAKWELKRLAGIEARKTFTDRIQDKGENERMHGHAYSNYTKLVYKIADIEYKKQDNFRETLSADELSKVEAIEKMIDSLLLVDKKYHEIKETLDNIFNKKAVNNE